MTMKWLLACLMLCTFALPAIPAAADPLTIEELIDPSGMTNATLSPDGKHIAAIVFKGNHYGLVLIDTSTFRFTKLGEGRYVENGFYRYLKAPRRVWCSGNELFVVDYGLEVESINLYGKRVASFGEQMIGVLESGPNAGQVLVRDSSLCSDLALCDPRKGKCKRFDQPSGKAIKWAFDGKGELRAVTVVNSQFFRDVSTVSNWYKPVGGAWSKLVESNVTDDCWLPVYVPDQPDTLVIGSRSGRDTTALFNYDVNEKRQVEMLVSHPSQDILSWQGIDQEAMNNVATTGMKPEQIWFTRAWRQMQMQAQVDAVLPKRVDVITGNAEKIVLIKSYGNVDSGTWYLFDYPQKKMTVVGKVNQALDPVKLRAVEIISYRAPDGLTIPAYLTRPEKRQGPAPMVVLIHGGPIARDEW